MLLPVESLTEFSPFADHAMMAAARGFFARGELIWASRAPGRLDVMGGNVDYTGGMVLQSTLREAVWVAVQPRTDDVIQVLNPGASRFGWAPFFEARIRDLDDPLNLRLRSQNDSSRWSTYVLGALCFLKHHYGCETVGGVNLFISSDLPPNRGVSSSAALEVAALKATSAAWKISLSGIALATAGQWVENVVVGAACGIMDQAAIVLGEENHLLRLLCQPCRTLPAMRLPENLRIWGIDSMAPRSTTGTAYEAARAAAFIGYKLICQREGIDVVPEVSEIPRWTDLRWNGYLSNLAPSEFRSKYEGWLPESLSGKEVMARIGEHVDPFTNIQLEMEYPIRAAVRYATEENLRVQMVSTLLQSDLSNSAIWLIGEIFCQSHVAYTECGLGSEDCDELVSRALKAGFAGAKMTGGGAGGVVAVLGTPHDQRAVYQVAQEYAAERNAMPHIFEGSSPGVDAFGIRPLRLQEMP
jgi:L-arabinokinase